MAIKPILLEYVTKEELEKLYVTDGLALQTIGKKFNVSVKAVSTALRHYGIEKRTKSESNVERHKRAARVNEDFFTTESADLFYVLGVIASDGYVTNENKIGISMNDADVVRYVKKVIGLKNKVVEIENYVGNISYRISFGNPRVCEALRKYGITERKSLTFKPANIPDEYAKDFIRGVFDGDGTIILKHMTTKTGKPTMRTTAGIVSGSHDFIKYIKQIIGSEIQKDVRITRDDRGNGVYLYYFSDRECIAKFAEWMYGEDFEAFGMARKKAKMKDIYDFVNDAQPTQKEAV